MGSKANQTPTVVPGQREFYFCKKTKKTYVLEEAEYNSIVNAVFSSRILRTCLEGERIKVDKMEVAFRVPVIGMKDKKRITEYMGELRGDTETGKTLRGLASINDVFLLGKFGAVFAFLMLGNNMIRNIQLNDQGQYCVSNLDKAFYLEGGSVTSSEGVFKDKVDNQKKRYNHFFELLEVCDQTDRGESFNAETSCLGSLFKKKWRDYFTGIKAGLELIHSKLTVEFIQRLPSEDESQIRIKTILLERVSHLSKNILFISDLIRRPSNGGPLPEKIEFSVNMEDCILSTLPPLDGEKIAFINKLKSELADKFDEFNPSPERLEQHTLANKMTIQLESVVIYRLLVLLQVGRAHAYSFLYDPGTLDKECSNPTWTSCIELQFDSQEKTQHMIRFIGIYNKACSKQGGDKKIDYSERFEVDSDGCSIVFDQDSAESFITAIKKIDLEVMHVISSSILKRRTRFNNFLSDVIPWGIRFSSSNWWPLVYAYEELLEHETKQPADKLPFRLFNLGTGVSKDRKLQAVKALITGGSNESSQLESELRSFKDCYKGGVLGALMKCASFQVQHLPLKM